MTSEEAMALHIRFLSRHCNACARAMHHGVLRAFHAQLNWAMNDAWQCITLPHWKQRCHRHLQTVCRLMRARKLRK